MLKYEKIYQSLLQKIQSGDFPAGAKLPSIRGLSQQYICSKSTILAALKRLEEQNIIYSIPKSGYYVMEHQIFEAPTFTEGIDFATSSPTWHAFPYKDFQQCINKAIDTYQEELFRYGTPKGLSLLIIEAKKLLESYQVFAKSEQIFITSGVQQALALLSMMPFPNNGSTILVEQPSYHLYMDMLKIYGIRTIGIPRTAQGIDLKQLEKIFNEEEIKFFYTMPRFHNPLGTSYSKKDKEAILQLAYKYNVYIIEDDYLADFEYNTKNDPLFAKDIKEQVIYLKSFSKIMFPGLRIGLAVLPTTILNTFQKFRTTIDIDSSMISQAALYLYIKSGMFEHNKLKVSSIYHKRAQALQQSLQNHLANYESSSELVMHGHILLPKQINMKSFIHYLHEQQVYLDSVESNYLANFHKKRVLKLNVSNVENHRIEEGVKKLASALKKRDNYFL
ncbi:aminotransferase-like domain-containing protein [Priestia megaterium]|uniref:aminotransferase-like domain-containing protein n=1 Tax=Priestia megaterium TaxID=1404 RepID=UPI002363763E|nr:PLP-dependent aminotransferase family protein [Priestia megaterium]MDD1516136.1 PLP-dependent aminotransferase family protein [Priestia megaterium]